MKIGLFYLLLCVFLAKNLSAQQYVPVTLVNGNYFYNHTVIEGNTLFDLQKLYSCPAEDILNENEGIERGLIKGQLVLIPAKAKTIVHTVEKNETLFSISKLFFISIDTIIKYNPNCDSGLKIDQQLKIHNAIIPIKINTSEPLIQKIPTANSKLDTSSIKLNSSLNDSIISYIVVNNETLYLISKRFMISVNELKSLNNMSSSLLIPGQVIKIRLKKEKFDEIEMRIVPSLEKIVTASLPLFTSKDSYSIALFLPFNLDSQTSINKNISNAAIEYYMGAKLAIDSLINLGFKAEFFIYDYFDKTKSLESILEQKSFLSIDLIIAPLHQKEAEIVALWAKKNNVRMIYSVSFSSNSLFENENSYTMVTSNEILLEKLAKKLIHISKDRQFVLVKSGNIADDSMYAHFLAAFRAEVSLGSNLKIIETNYDKYKLFIKNGHKTCFIFLSSEKEKVISLLNYCKENELFQLVGLKEWIDFKEINSEIKNKFSFYYMAPSYFSYNDPALKPFHKLFRKKYNTDLTKMSCLGYDVIYNACKYSYTGQVASSGLISKFSFVKNGVGNGFQNTGCFLLNFEDFESKISSLNE